MQQALPAQLLVRIAIMRYILDGDETDVSQAVVRLCERLESKLVPQAKQDADAFRRTYCYLEAVDNALSRHKRSLRALFDAAHRFVYTARIMAPKVLIASGTNGQLATGSFATGVGQMALSAAAMASAGLSQVFIIHAHNRLREPAGYSARATPYGLARLSIV